MIMIELFGTAVVNNSYLNCVQLGLICGTSSCHMALSRKPIQVPGVWGPYFSAILPNFYTAEGGQSAVGSLLDHVLKR